MHSQQFYWWTDIAWRVGKLIDYAEPRSLVYSTHCTYRFTLSDAVYRLWLGGGELYIREASTEVSMPHWDFDRLGWFNNIEIN